MKSFKQMIQLGEIKRADAMKIQLADIHEEPGFNLRAEGDDLQASIEALAAYIMGGGVYPALEVRPRSEGGVWVVDGHRRRRALILAREQGAPIEWVNVVAFVGNDADRVTRIITSAEGRALTPLETATGYKRLAAFGLGSDEIAARVGKTRQHVDQLMILANANTDVQQLVATGGVSAAVAVKVVREHGEEAGEVLGRELDKAKAAGRAKVTDGTMKEWAPPAKVVGPLVDALEALVDMLDGSAYTQLNAARDGEPNISVLAPALPMAALVDALEQLRTERERHQAKQREKAAKARQIEI